MKKLFFTSIMLVSFTCSFAQLKVNSDGVSLLGEEMTFDSIPALFLQSKRLVSIGSKYSKWHVTNASNLASTLMNPTSNYNIGILGEVYSSSVSTGNYNAGVVGLTDGNALTATYGIAGLTKSNTSNGSGVYGSTYPTFSSITGHYAGYFLGPVRVTSTLTVQDIVTTSDVRLKENIQPIGGFSSSSHGALDNILDMNIVQYNFKPIETEASKNLLENNNEDVEQELEKIRRNEERLHFGVLAQELQTIYPNLVEEGQDGYLAVNYVELVPVLIKAIQELNEEIDALKGGDAVRKARSTSGMDHEQATNVNRLYQNNPNPFKEATIIRFSLADDAADAAVCIFDMTGKQLRRIPVTAGMDYITINGRELGAGMFLYSLIVNGQEIDTKRMILSK